MTYTEFIRRSISFVLIVIGAILLTLLIIRVYPILVIGLLSWIASVGLSIPVNFFRRKGMPRNLALATTFLLTIIAIVLFVRILLPPLASQVSGLIAELPDAGRTAVEDYSALRGGNETLSGILPEFTVEDYENLLHNTGEGNGIQLDAVAGSVFPVIAGVGGFFATIFVNLFLIFFITIYLTINPLVYYRMILAVVPKNHEERALEILENIRRTMGTWVGSMILEVTITALMVTFALGVILRIPNAIALGALAGLGNIVPYVGYWAALIPILIFAAATGGFGTAVLAFIFYFIIGIIEANIILPANIGNSLKLPAAAILVFQGIAGSLMGFWGILLAVPMLAIVVTLIRELLIFDWLGKRGRVPFVLETANGELVLDRPPVNEPETESAQESPLTKPDAPETQP